MTNLKRWSKISNSDICTDYNILYCLLRIYLSFYNNNTQNVPGKRKIVTIIQKYSGDRSEDHITNIINTAIIYNYSNIIDHLRNHINIKEFIDYNEHTVPDHILKMAKGNKLIKYMKPVLISSDTCVGKAYETQDI